MSKKAELAELVKELAVVHGKVTLSSGKDADYYVDLRRATLHSRASRLIGELLRELTADWDYVAVGGLTLDCRRNVPSRWEPYCCRCDGKNNSATL